MRKYELYEDSIIQYFIYYYIETKSAYSTTHILIIKKIKSEQFQLLSLHQLAIWHQNNANTFSQVKYRK